MIFPLDLVRVRFRVRLGSGLGLGLGSFSKLLYFIESLEEMTSRQFGRWKQVSTIIKDLSFAAKSASTLDSFKKEI